MIKVSWDTTIKCETIVSAGQVKWGTIIWSRRERWTEATEGMNCREWGETDKTGWEWERERLKRWKRRGFYSKKCSLWRPIGLTRREWWLRPPLIGPCSIGKTRSRRCSRRKTVRRLKPCIQYSAIRVTLSWMLQRNWTKPKSTKSRERTK